MWVGGEGWGDSGSGGGGGDLGLGLGLGYGTVAMGSRRRRGFIYRCARAGRCRGTVWIILIGWRLAASGSRVRGAAQQWETATDDSNHTQRTNSGYSHESHHQGSASAPE